MSGDLESVRVALRVRPLVNSEKARGCQVAVEKMEGLHQVLVNNNDAFSFNFVFDWRDTQETVYNLSVSDMLDKLFKGFNATILAYGQTGSGKTHTMGTAFDGSLDEDVGVIPRAMHDIFERIKQLANEFDFIIKCSFMELYQEQLYDLLSDKSREESVVEMREDRNGILMVGLTEKEVYDAKETTDCLVKGSGGRAVASTAMNQASSRSHAIFTVTLQATKKDESRAVTTSKFHLVDLAGSERSKKTGATGDRFKEGVKINQGLLALGNVISALGDGKGAGFVRYRDSKLTRLLQDSLGGNSVTLMIACVSPADYNVAETLSTLRYADRARKIKNKPIVNQDPHAAEINRLKGIIQKLRVELLTKGGTMTASLTKDLEVVGSVAPLMTNSMPMLMPSDDQNRKYKELQEKYRNLQQQWQMTLHDVTEHEMRAHIAEAAHENLKQNVEEMKEFISELTKIQENHTEDGKLQETVMHISKLVAGFDNELARTQTEIMDHKHRSSLGSSVNGGDSEENDGSVNSSEMHAIIQERTEAFTSKQIEINDQLRRINRELNLKEQLQQRMAGNFSKFSTLDDDIEEKFKECEQKIQELEAEKFELLDKLRHVKENASAKLAEERRKRLQTLEQEISDMKRKNTQQAKLLKIREKETQKIRNLSTEIQAMKESKVKLIRAMRSEAENFRQFKMMREKEVMQLKNKDRKMQNEMARKEALHNKQRNVLKRKCEEAMAINKRLKDALEKQKVAQTQRQKMQSAKDATAASVKIDQIIACVERELEVIISLIDAERTLEQLMDDRGIISSRLGELENQEPYPDPQSQNGMEIANLQEELEMRNAQISDLQLKVCANDLDTLIRSLGENVQNLAESRAVFKYLLKTLADMRREHNQVVEELRSQFHTAEEKSNDTDKIIRQMKLEHEEAIAEYEEKISLALTPEQEQRLKLQEEQEKKIESLMIELENYKQLREEANHKKKRGKTSAKNIPVIKPEPMDEDIIEEEEEFTESEDSFNMSEDDPDWIKTPMHRKRPNVMHRRTSQTSHRSISQSDISHSMDEGRQQGQVSFNSINSGTFAGTANTSSKGKHKRKSKGCKCRGDCGNQRCGCNSLHQKCTVGCSCTSKCKNRSMGTSPKNDSEDERGEEIIKNEKDSSSSEKSDNENHVKSPANKNSLTQQSEDTDAAFLTTTNVNATSYLTPKMARMTTIKFDTATAKKKFFED